MNEEEKKGTAGADGGRPGDDLWDSGFTKFLISKGCMDEGGAILRDLSDEEMDHLKKEYEDLKESP